MLPASFATEREIVYIVELQPTPFVLLLQVTYYVVNSTRNEGKDFFEINRETGDISTKIIFDREKQGAYALEVEARDGAPSARPNGNGQPNSGMYRCNFSLFLSLFSCLTFRIYRKQLYSFSSISSTFITHGRR